MLSRQALKEILELVGTSGGSFIVLEKDSPKLAILEFATYQKLVARAEAGLTSANFIPVNTVPQHVLVTGGHTPLAELVIRELLRSGFKVSVLDNTPAEAPAGVEIYHADYREPAQVAEILQANKFEAVIHLDEMAGHKESFDTPENYFLSNVEQSVNFLKLLAAHDIRKFIFKSSAAGNSPYARTKFLFEQILSFYHQSFGLSSVSLRLPSLALPSSSPGDVEAALFENPLMTVLDTAAGKIDCLPIARVNMEASDDSPIVEFMDMGDAARAFVFALHHLENSVGSMVYKVDGIKTSVSSLVEAVLSTSQKMIPTSRTAATSLWDEREPEVLPSLSDLGYQARLSDLESIIREHLPKYDFGLPAVEPAGSVMEAPEIRQPVSLSEVLSGRFTTPFIKPHSS